MLLQQICPGKANSEPQSIHVFACQGTRYIAYGSGDKVLIYADPNTFMQTLIMEQEEEGNHNNVVAITSYGLTNQLAAAFGQDVALFLLDSETQKWKIKSVLHVDYEITSLDWNANGQLLIAGKRIQIWEEQEGVWNKLWSIDLATPVSLAQFSPNGTMFATIGQFDHLVAVWYCTESKKEGTKEYDFIYLSHPRDVTHFAWRQQPASNSAKDCTLFTMCRDGVGRFWSPTDINTPYRLYMCAVIDPSQSLVTADSSTSICSSSHHSLTTHSTDHNDNHADDFSSIHYIGCHELENALRVLESRQKAAKQPQALDHQMEKMKDMLRDTPDLLFRLQPDGSIIFWGVQYLNSWPRRIPKTFVMLRIDQTIAPEDVVFFLQHIIIMHDMPHIQSLSTVKPMELSLITRNTQGEIRCYGLNLVDFLDSVSFEPRLRLKYSWVGHQHYIQSIYQTQSNQLVTTSSDGQINVWKYGLDQTSGCLEARLSLKNSSKLQNALLSVPIDKDGLLAVYTGERILIYNIDSHCHLLQDQECQMYEPSAPLSDMFVQVIGDSEDDSDSNNTVTPWPSSSASSSCSAKVTSAKLHYLLIGISANASKIFTWKISDIGANNNVCMVTFGGCQDMSWEAESTVITQGSHRWAGGMASKFLQSPTILAQKDNQISTMTTLVVGVKSVLYLYGIECTKENKDTDYILSSRWKELYRMDTRLGKTLLIASVMNNIAIVAFLDSVYTLSIWMEMRNNVPPRLVKTFNFKEPIKDMAWYISSDAQFFLAVAFAHKVSIYGQKRASQINKDDDEIWIPYTEIDVDSEQVISGIVWVDHGVLVVTVGNQLRCYPKWLTGQETTKAVDEIHGNSIGLFDLSCDLNGPLPLYHPRHLLHYLLLGKVDLINNILSSLLTTLRQFADTSVEQLTGIAPPFGLRKILELQNTSKVKTSNRQQQYSDLFSDEDREHDQSGWDCEDYDEDTKPLALDEAKQLKKYLEERRLPGLCDRDRMHLLAMIDTFVEITNQGEALDENGARFLALLQNHFHLNKLLPDEQKQDLESRDIAYALHSQSQDILLEQCVRLCGGKLLWQDAKSLGLFLWLQKMDVVKEQVAAIARNTYLAKEELKDPVDCTLFYLALRKKALLHSLWRSASYHKEQRVMVSFLANDFTEPRWQKAAAKNAFVLLGRQRFEYAAAFFLLADKLKDAINVILKNLKDYQLAIVVCRVYDGDDSPLLKEILNSYVLPLAVESSDRWLLTIAYWLLGKTHDAIRSIVVPLQQIKLEDASGLSSGRQSHFSVTLHNTSTRREQLEESDSADTVNDPTLFILYQHVKHNLPHPHKELGIPYELEYLFSLQVARAYERIGCPLLALYVLTQYHLKSPSEMKHIGQSSQQLSSRSDDSSLASNNNSDNVSRAIDLFDNDSNQATFAAKPNGKMSKAADIFADDSQQDIFATSSNREPSKSSNLFPDNDGDIFATRSKNTEDIFASITTSPTAEDDKFADDGVATDKQSLPPSQCKIDATAQLEELRPYKTLMVIRTVQNVFHAATAMYHASSDKILVSRYRQQYLDNQQTLVELGEQVGIEPSVMSKLLTEKCIETDIFPVYFNALEICTQHDCNSRYLLESFQLTCFQIFGAVTSSLCLDLPALTFFENWMNGVMETFGIWSMLMKKYSRTEYASNRTSEICLSAYVCLILVTTKQRHFEKTWSLLSHFADFMDHIYSNNPTTMIVSIFEEISNNDTKLIEMDHEDFESFSDDSTFGFDLNEEKYKPKQDFSDNSMGALILELASLNVTLSNLEQSMHFSKTRKLDAGDTVDFIWSTLLDPIAYRVHCLQSQMDKELGHDITRSSILRHLKTLRQRKFWHSIRTLLPVTDLLPFARFSPPEVNISTEEPHQPHSNTVYNAGTTIHAFCINQKTGINDKTGGILAVCTKSEIQEIDINKAQRLSAPLVRVGSASSKDWNLNEFVESYPDTEEELESNASDVELDSDSQHHYENPRHQQHHQHNGTNIAKSPLGTARRPLHHASSSSTKSSTASAPISSTGVNRLLQPEDRTRNSSFDNLQETLKRSLGVGKEGLDVSKLPAGGSLTGSTVGQGERVITLKRCLAATCAETHPEYPFYITGCEVSSDGPSAFLWQFGQDREIATYYGCRGKVTRVHFDSFGQKFGAGDTSGTLCLWKFDSHSQPNKPYYSNTCHTKATRDFTFLNSSSLIATAGTSVTMSRRRDHLCIWDTLLPPSSSMVCSLPGHDNGAYAVAYEDQGNLIFSGGKRGEIVVSDIRQRTTMHTFTAHSSRIRSIAIDSQHHTLITGSIDGELKIWDASTYKQKQVFDIQPRNRFLAPSFNRIPLKAFGVTQIQLVGSDGYVYTSGPGGIIRCST